jgi:hypothetical protein
MPDPVHPDDYTFSLFGEIENPVENSLEELRRRRCGVLRLFAGPLEQPETVPTRETGRIWHLA